MKVPKVSPPSPSRDRVVIGRRDFLGKYCNFYIIYKSWQYSLIPIVSGQVWARAKVPKMPKIKSFTAQPFDHSTTFILRCAHRAWGFMEVIIEGIKDIPTPGTAKSGQKGYFHVSIP